ncbi:transcription factor HES-5-like isoform X2 [Strix uralensis]|uniref:transcription factor HES-5-like isoform X2 n=1 Tax=Strix uralensis TaxID=36305 RepID=UPI003DA74DA2
MQISFSSMWIRRVLLGAILGALSPGHRPPRQVAVLSVRLCSDSSRLPLFIHQGASADIKAAFCFTWAKRVSQSPEGDQRALAYRENELRKPVVEKMRRDRINSSIEQLKLLLEKEFQRHQPNSKLEKADILEMTVSYLKQQSQLQMKTAGSFHKSSQFDFREGYSRCLQEAFHFLSLHKVRTETQTKLLSHFQKSQSAATEVPFSPGTASTLKQASPKDASTLWRPW